MFGSTENANCVEALIPTEQEVSVFLLTSSNVEQSNSISEAFIAGCEVHAIWWNHLERGRIV
jgi:hypothetical protein